MALIASKITLPGTGEDVVTQTNPAGEKLQGIYIARSDTGDPVIVDANGQKVYLTAALPAGTNNIGDVDVLSLPALPGGTNAIGKLAANSGVDIGDVDVLSLPALPAGTNVIGSFKLTDGTTGAVIDANGSLQMTLADTAGNPLAFSAPGELTASPTIYSAATALALDSLHTTIMTFANAARANGATGRILGARLVCKHNTFAGIIALHVFRKSVTGTTAGDTLAVSDPDKLECVGALIFDFSATFQMGGGMVANAWRGSLPMDYKCDAGTASLFGIMQVIGVGSGAVTFGAGDLVPFISFAAD